MSKHGVPSTLATGYALGAASASEARDFTEVAAVLGLAVPAVHPPAELKATILAGLAVTPRLTLVAGGGAGAGVRAGAGSGGSAGRPEGADARGRSGGPEGLGARGRSGADARAHARRWYTRPVGILAAAAAAALLVVGGTAVGISVIHSPTTIQHEAGALSRINTAQDVQTASTRIATGGTAHLIWSTSLAKSAIQIDGLERAPAGKTYELWYVRDGRAIPAGTMEVTATGPTTHVLAGSLAVGDAVAVTVEPVGGSKQPTSVPILSIET